MHLAHGRRTKGGERHNKRLAPAILWLALIASLCWFILLLLYNVAFLDTPQEARFLEIDQIIADDQRHLQRRGAQEL